MAVYTVSQVSSHIKESLESDPLLMDLWVVGEVSGLRASSAGHTYFSLKDRDSLLRCVMFRGMKGAELLSEGDSVSAHGKITFYTRGGTTDFMVDLAMPEGVGELALELERLKQKLAAEGLFETSRKRQLPRFPEKVGVVTSPTGAVFHDIQNVLQRRYPLAQLVLSPTIVQGQDAAPKIATALELLDREGGCDVIIIGRGGGSLEDLWPFNEEKVARSIHACTIPIISAVGHETDISISDLVADVRAPTPSVAAELVSPSRENLIGDLEQIFFDLNRALEKQLQQRWQYLDHLTDRAVFQQPGREVVRKRDRLETAIHQLVQSAQYRIKMSQSQLEGAQEILTVLNPQNVLERGYSIAMTVPEREIIRSARALGAGDPFQVQTARGKFSAVKTNDMKEK